MKLNNKGINLIALIVMIIIMIIIAAIAYTNSLDAHDKALLAREKEENLNVTTAVEHRFGDYMTNSTISPISGVIIPSEYTTVDEKYNYIITYLKGNGKLTTERHLEYEEGIMNLLKSNSNHSEYTRILEHSHLVELGVENLPTNAMYVVNYYGTAVVGPIY